ncbi:hypothetical protein N0V90_009926 [Kalmusia sp. IMI 367209]|nr:hypothetical protein N0V90_009926 [Kalmusia sp. IMI 367209]
MDTASLDAMKLTDRLRGLRQEEYWLHLDTESPLDKYPAKQHARRVRDRLDVAEGLIYLPGAPLRSNEDSDMPAPFRQRRYFYYLSGCNEPTCHLAYDIKQDVLTLFIPRVNPDRVFWNGRGPTPAEALDRYDIDEVFYSDELESWIQDWFLHYRYDERLYVLHDDQVPTSRFPWPVDSTSLQPAIDQCRMIKDEHEIKLIRKANDISSEAHKQVLANITKFKNEAQVEGLFLNVCISKQAKQQAYDPIAASGPNAGTLHYDANNEDFDDRQLMCLDAGCEFDLYASDITRTFPLSGSWPSKEAENIYKLVERMQESCIQKLAPGVRYLDLHILAHHIAIDGLLRLGILHNGTREEIYKAGTSKAFFPHGLGHHVGLEVHDVGQRELMSLYQNPKYEKVPSLYPEDFHLPVYDKDLCMAPTHPQSPHLEEGMVVTVEPGIYFSAYVLSYFYLPSPVHSRYINKEVLYRYFPVGGVRIEDDLLITSKGYENLTTAPKGDEMLSIILNQGFRPSSATKSILRSMDRKETIEEPLRRAPGIPTRVKDQVLKPISRAATEPARGMVRASAAEKEGFDNHWLFSGTKNMNEDTSTGQKEQVRRFEIPIAHLKSLPPLCGVRNDDVEHVTMGWQNESGQLPAPSASRYERPRPKCQQCIVLSETVDRLRKTLSRSTRTSPRPEAGMPLHNVQPASVDKVPEMRQITPLVPSKIDDRKQNITLPNVPPEHSKPTMSLRHNQPPPYRPAGGCKVTDARSCTIPSTIGSKASELSSFETKRRLEQEMRSENNGNMAATPSNKGTATLALPPSQRSIYDFPLPSDARTTLDQEARQRRPQPAGSRTLAATLERAREHHTDSARLMRGLSAQPSLPTLRPGQASEIQANESSALSQARQILLPPAQESARDPARRRSMGGALRTEHSAPGQASGISPLSSNPYLSRRSTEQQFNFPHDRAIIAQNLQELDRRLSRISRALEQRCVTREDLGDYERSR